MAALQDIWTFSRFLWGLPKFLNFLHGLKSILDTPQSPYRALFETAKCEFADVAKIVEQDGIESALRALRGAGVYVTFEEFKGREPMVRNGREIPLTPQSFDNPLQSRAFHVSTGGSTGRGRAVAIDLEHLWASIPARLLNDSIHGFIGIPTALWFDDLPGNGPNSVLTRVPYDSVPERWFSPIADGDARPALKFRVASGESSTGSSRRPSSGIRASSTPRIWRCGRRADGPRSPGYSSRPARIAWEAARALVLASTAPSCASPYEPV